MSALNATQDGKDAGIIGEVPFDGDEKILLKPEYQYKDQSNSDQNRRRSQWKALAIAVFSISLTLFVWLLVVKKKVTP